MKAKGEIVILHVDGTFEIEPFPEYPRMSQIVGGYIETVRIHSKIRMICNEDGISRQLATNPIASRFYGNQGIGILGDVFFCGVGMTKDGPDLCGLDKAQVDELTYIIKEVQAGTI